MGTDDIMNDGFSRALRFSDKKIGGVDSRDTQAVYDLFANIPNNGVIHEALNQPFEEGSPETIAQRMVRENWPAAAVLQTILTLEILDKADRRKHFSLLKGPTT